MTPNARDPVDDVNPLIGTLSYKTWSTSPTVQLPHGMVEIDPLTTPGIGDKYLADKIYGFSFSPAASSARHIASLMASKGALTIDPAANASEFDHDLERAAPYYYLVLLEDSDIQVEVTVSRCSAYYRFSFPPCEQANLLLSIPTEGQMALTGEVLLQGWQVLRGVRHYFFALLSTPAHTVQSWQDNQLQDAHQVSGSSVGLGLGFDAPDGQIVEVKAGFSYISEDQARRNLEREIPHWEFETTVKQARAIWNEVLSRIEIEGGTPEQRTIFYTAMYRNLCRMKNLTEDGRYFSPFDGQVHAADGHDFYNCDQPWDTYRCARPLQFIIEPERGSDFLQSFVWMYEQNGFLPITPDATGEHATMVGRHLTTIITDGYLKGYREFDVENAFEGMKKSALERTMLPWKRGPATELDHFYYQHGYFPALPVRPLMQAKDLGAWRQEISKLIHSRMPYQITWLPEVGVDEWVSEVDPWHRRQSVSVTLENAYNDWCVAEMARALGKTADEAHFLQRAHNYRNLFNPQTGFMSPKTADDEWVEPFDPKLSGGFAGEGFFAEMNAWTYTFHVQHDVQGLVDLLGGREAFGHKLDQLFVEQYVMDKPAFWGQFPDSSGLIGQYAHGNEPSFHIPYLYNYAGAPWKTQRRVRDIMKLWYSASPMGLCGDDDIGALSSWYVFSAMGFYPVCPGRPVYDLGSPLFEKVTLHLANGKTFLIAALDVSESNKYIQSAKLNGQPWDKAWINHADLVNGGSLELEMGPRPNKSWASSPESVPPSMSSPAS